MPAHTESGLLSDTGQRVNGYALVSSKVTVKATEMPPRTSHLANRPEAQGIC